MPVLYIHAGFSKTGTTALQSFFHNNRALIAENCDIYYPKTGIPRSKVKHRDLFPIKPYRWKRLKKEVAAYRAHDILLSDEYISTKNFSLICPPYFETIQQTFPDYTIKVILYARRLDDYCRSKFADHLKRWGTLHRIADYPTFLKTGDLFSSKGMEEVVGLVGKENFLGRIYDRKYLKNNDIIADFFDLIGREQPVGTVPPTIINESIPDSIMPFLSSSFLPLLHKNPLRSELRELLIKAYTFPKGEGAGEDLLPRYEEEINKIDAFIPGYKDLFAERKLSFSYPESDIKNPHEVFTTALLYKILIQLNKQAAQFKFLQALLLVGCGITVFLLIALFLPNLLF